MKKSYKKKCLLLSLVVICLFYFQASAQTRISGKVIDATTGQPLVGVSIQVKDRIIGTSSNSNGAFVLAVQTQPPFTIMVTSIGYESQEIEIIKENETLDIQMNSRTIMGDDVIVSASRVPGSLLQSPVSVELINTRDIQSSPQSSFYDALINIKGVEMTTQSLTFKSVNTRGFGANGNTRVVQLIDGMDNQAPGLNFAVGNVVGMSELDVASVELLPGAASALYGPNAINGLLLMNSKSPFDYQGVSAYVKSGVMNASNRTKVNTGYYDMAFRFAKSYNNRFAFKVNAAYLTADDWQATDYRDQSFLNGTNLENNIENVQNSNRYDGVNWYGDVGTNVYDILRGNGMPGDGTNGTSGALGAIMTTQIAQAGGLTLPQLLGGTTAAEQLGLANDIFNTITPQYYYSAPGYSEQQLTDYDTKSLKFNASLHYRLTDDVEAILQANWGKGSAVYTAADRYNIQNFTMGQYKAELRGDNFFVRGYTTRENSGDAHALGVLGGLMSSRWLGTAIGQGAPSFVSSSITQYTTKLLTDYQTNLMDGMPQPQAMGAAYLSAKAFAEANRNVWMADALAPGAATANGMYNVGGTEFEAAMADVKSKPIPQGAHFLDRSNMYHAEGMYDFKRLIDPEAIELLVGANYRVYDLNSEGTLFATTPDGKEFNIKEWGAYVQGAKSFADVFKLTASIRYDKNENFEGQFSPRISGVYTFIPNHNLRASFQQGFRIPTTQNQYIDLLTPQARLIGGLPLFIDKYDMVNNPVYRLTADGSAVPYQYKKWQPERVETYELGYKSLISEKLIVDAFYYYNRFLTFEGSMILVQKKDVNGPMTDLGDATKRNAYSMPTNSEQTVKNSGWGIGLDYLIGDGYVVNGNVTQNVLLNEKQLKENDPSFITSFNSPKFRYNVGLSNRDINRSGYGFGITFRHQTETLWNGSIATLTANTNGSTIIPAYSTVDAQVSKKLPLYKSTIKLGATNIGSKLYQTGWGNPSVGGMYYLSISFDELLN